ncbi:MAG TPA: alpha/beta hydrolase [Mariniphaga sp.]|nr:alpha/beta hydrolase [Mariniphaga sp.]
MLKIKFLPRFIVLMLLVLSLDGNTTGRLLSISDNSNDDLTEVEIIHNLRYGKTPKGLEENSSSDRQLDLYLPKGTKENMPVLIFIHGGGYSGGDKKANADLCQKISEHGIAVVSMNYYLTLKHEKIAGVSCSANMAQGIPEDGFHPQLNKAIKNAAGDTKKVIKWVKMNSGKYGFDLSSVSLAGGSAGAMTALYTAFVSGQKILPIHAVVNLWGGLENPELVKRNAPPVLTYHGDLDKLIHVEYSYTLHKHLEKTGDTKSQFHVLENKGHAMYKLIANEKVEEIAEFLK